MNEDLVQSFTNLETKVTASALLLLSDDDDELSNHIEKDLTRSQPTSTNFFELDIVQYDFLHLTHRDHLITFLNVWGVTVPTIVLSLALIVSVAADPGYLGGGGGYYGGGGYGGGHGGGFGGGYSVSYAAPVVAKVAYAAPAVHYSAVPVAKVAVAAPVYSYGGGGGFGKFGGGGYGGYGGHGWGK
uniref:Uncharacterized protein n=1 Tax=Glossina austeni TaxID=7395 RepID=A0A1A9UJ62_GLOAU